MKPTPLNLLLNLARENGVLKKTTLALAGDVGVSQQTASRWLSQLENEGLVERTPAGARLTGEALKLLSGLKAEAGKASARKEFYGIVVKGLGEGSYYMSLDGYKKQIRSKLGFTPYPGTLNVKLAGKTDLENAAALKGGKGIPIAGFKDRKTGRFYGGAKCFKALLNGFLECAVIVPDRTHHESDVLEVIAPVFVRAHLKRKAGKLPVKITLS